MPQIVAMGGGGFGSDEGRLVDDFVLGLTGRDTPRTCFVPTAGGDAEGWIERFHHEFGGGRAAPSHLSLFRREVDDLAAFLLGQDVIYVGGGNTKSLLAVWRDWGVDEILREAWQAGIVLTGVSAGAICWFEQGLTDSFADGLRPLDCLGFLPGSCCPHFDGEPQRRPSYHRLLASGEIAAGVAIEDWTGVHYIGVEMHQVVTSKRGARAYAMRAAHGSVQEVPLAAEVLAAP